MLILRIILVLWLLLNAMFAQAKTRAHHKLPSVGMTVGSMTYHHLKDKPGLPISGMYVIKFQGDPKHIWNYATPGATESSGDLMKRRIAKYSATGRIVVQMVADVTSMVVPVQEFVDEYSTYDSGDNKYSYGAVHIKPIITKGKVIVSVQLRY